MARNDSMWQKVKKTFSNEIRDDEKLAANLGVFHGFKSTLKVYSTHAFGDPSKRLEELRVAFEKFRRQLRERIYERRLLRAVALFAGSVFVMRNFGELMAV